MEPIPAIPDRFSVGAVVSRQERGSVPRKASYFERYKQPAPLPDWREAKERSRLALEKASAGPA